MQKVLVVATTNEHKIIEIAAIVGSFGYTVVSRAAAGVPSDFEIDENEATFEGNSILKARGIFDCLGQKVSTIADDSGLVIDALGGAPGVYSARFASINSQGGSIVMPNSAGEGQRMRQDKRNNEKALALLSDIPFEKRTAKFVSAVTCIRPDREPIVCIGEVAGHIGFKEEGQNGFGYDPLFIPLGYNKSFGLFTPAEKDSISHRGRALSMLAEKLAADLS